MSRYAFSEIRSKESNHGVGVSDQVPERIQEALVLHHLGIDVMKFGHTYCCGLPHIGVFILQTLSQRLAQVLSDLIHTNTSHCTHSQSSDQWVRILTVLKKERTTSDNLVEFHKH